MNRDTSGRFLDGNHRRTHGMSQTRLYGRWKTMVARCHNPNCTAYHKYGAKGIKVCDRWRLFENFYADMGEPEPGMTLERLDSNGDYEPSNVVWADYNTQNNNRPNYTGRKPGSRNRRTGP